MRLIVGLGQMLKIQAGVDLRRGDVGVTQQILHGTKVLRRLQQVAGKAVAQDVGMQMCRQARCLRDPAQLELHDTRGDARTART